MSVRSIFEFKFPSNAAQEGAETCIAIGNDMTSLSGYMAHEVIQDEKDPGHLMVNTLWTSQEASAAVLGKYQHDAKIKRAKELIGAEPTGFVGKVLSEPS